MAPDRWNSSWRDYGPSTPLPVEGGLTTSKQRGAMAGTWWSQRFVTVLESYGLGGRMQRGRRYARTGQVIHLDVDAGAITAAVQGSRREPYQVAVELAEPNAAQWESIDAAIGAKVGFVAQLLAGELPTELEAVFDGAGVDLFPPTWSAVRADCSCPDWGNPCKHIAAVLYVFADQLDTDPWLLLAWRGRTREQLLTRFRGHPAEDHAPKVAPWWPLTPGPLPEFDRSRDASTLAGDVLASMAPLDVDIAGQPFTDVIRAVYDATRPGA